MEPRAELYERIRGALTHVAKPVVRDPALRALAELEQRHESEESCKCKRGS